MKKIIFSLLLAIGLTACGEKIEEPKEKPVVKIGISLPLTGNMANVGKNMHDSLKLALDDIKKSKNLKNEYVLLFEDDQYEIKKAVLNYNRLKNVSKVNAIMSFWGTMGTIASKFAQENKIIHMSCALSDEVGKGYYNFNHATKMVEHLNNIVSYYKKHNLKTVSIVSYNAIEALPFLDSLKKEFSKAGIEILQEYYVNPGETDFKTIIAMLQEKNPEALQLQLLSPSSKIFAKQMKDLNYSPKIMNMNDLLSVPEYYEGAVVFTEETGNDDFLKHFRSETGQLPLPCAVNMYDGLRMLIEAFEIVGTNKNGSVSANRVVQAIFNNKNFKSVMTKIDLDKEGNINSPSIVKVIRDSQAVPIIE